MQRVNTPSRGGHDTVQRRRRLETTNSDDPTEEQADRINVTVVNDVDDERVRGYGAEVNIGMAPGFGEGDATPGPHFWQLNDEIHNHSNNFNIVTNNNNNTTISAVASRGNGRNDVASLPDSSAVDEDDLFALSWPPFADNLHRSMAALYDRGLFTDVTLICATDRRRGFETNSNCRRIRCHKVILVAGSSYFEDMIEMTRGIPNPLLIMEVCLFEDLKLIVDFMYHGKIEVEQECLTRIIKLATALSIKGLGVYTTGALVTSANTVANDSNSFRLQYKRRRTSSMGIDTQPNLTTANNRVNQDGPLSSGPSRPDGGSDDSDTSSEDSYFNNRGPAGGSPPDAVSPAEIASMDSNLSVSSDESGTNGQRPDSPYPFSITDRGGDPALYRVLPPAPRRNTQLSESPEVVTRAMALRGHGGGGDGPLPVNPNVVNNQLTGGGDGGHHQVATSNSIQIGGITITEHGVHERCPECNCVNCGTFQEYQQQQQQQQLFAAAQQPTPPNSVGLDEAAIRAILRGNTEHRNRHGGVNNNPVVVVPPTPHLVNFVADQQQQGAGSGAVTASSAQQGSGAGVGGGNDQQAVVTTIEFGASVGRDLRTALMDRVAGIFNEHARQAAMEMMHFMPHGSDRR